jgi:hypothetical protein
VEMSSAKGKNTHGDDYDGDDDDDDDVITASSRGLITEDCFAAAASRRLPAVRAAAKAVAAARETHGADTACIVWEAIAHVCESQAAAAAAAVDDANVTVALNEDMRESATNAALSSSQAIVDIEAALEATPDDAAFVNHAGLVAKIKTVVTECASAAMIAVTAGIPDAAPPPPVTAAAGVQTGIWMDDVETQTDPAVSSEPRPAASTESDHSAAGAGAATSEALAAFEGEFSLLQDQLTEGKGALAVAEADKYACRADVEAARMSIWRVREEMDTLSRQMTSEGLASMTDSPRLHLT